MSLEDLKVDVVITEECKQSIGNDDGFWDGAW